MPRLRGLQRAYQRDSTGDDKRPLLTNRLKLFMATMILANVAGSTWRPLLPLSLRAPYLGAMLWECLTPQFPFYIPLVATLLLLPIMWH